MRLSDLSIKNPVMAWMIMGFLLIFGAISFSRIGISQFPDVDMPTVNVSVNLAGASPEVIESNIVEPLEDSLMSLEGLSNISSSSRSGTANITVEFDIDRNIDAALQEVQTRVSSAQRKLPKDIDPPIISKSNPDDQPIMWLAVTSESGDRRELMKYTREVLKDQFTSVNGVGDIFMGGFSDPVLAVEVIPEKLKQYNITVLDVLETIQTEHNELPAGQIETSQSSFNVRLKGEAKTLDEFKELVISKRGGLANQDIYQKVRLKDVADIKLALGDDKKFAKFQGQMAVGLGIKKQRGTNAVAVAERVIAKMNDLNKNLAKGYRIQLNFDSTEFIKRSIRELNKHLVIAVLLTALVCWVFLGSWSATFNVLLSIPTSIFGAFIALYFLGFTLNTFTLLGLTLAIGIVVDDSIMVLENIFRQAEKGKSKIASAIVGSREITFAALAASAAVIAIFLPVAFMKGIIGKYFLQFGVTISFAVLFSLIESLTITPMRCASFVSHSERRSRLGMIFDRVFESFQKTYLRQLDFCLRHAGKTLVFSFVLMIAGFYLVKFIPKELTPAQESGLVMLRAQLRTGTPYAQIKETTEKIETYLSQNQNVQQVYLSLGGFGGGNDLTTSMMFISLKKKSERPQSQEAFIKEAREALNKLVTARISMQDPTARSMGGGGRGFPIEFAIKGPDWDQLVKSADVIMEDMKNSQLLVDIDSNLLMGLPEIQIVPDREKSSNAGVSVSSTAKTINAMIGGATAGQYVDGGKRYDIQVKLRKSSDEKKDLENLLVNNSRGNLVPLSQIVKFNRDSVLQQINHDTRLRTITIYANPAPGVSTEKAYNYVREKVPRLLPAKHFMEEAGTSKSQKEVFQSLIFALILGLVVAYMILAAQFNSFLDPWTVLMALPYSISGAFLALVLTQQSLNMYSMIGILLLMGIVKKNSILLVEFANTYRLNQANVSSVQAMLEAGKVRLRPILMTSFATIAGAVPSALARSEGSELTRPMAITVIGGVFVSTFLTLLVIPALYAITDRFKKSFQAEHEIRQAFSEVGNEGT